MRNPKDLMGIKKVPMHLVPSSSIIYQAMGMRDGAKKYGPYNWRNHPVIASIYIDALYRHVSAWLDGEEVAEDSGVPHLGHALSCLGILVDALENGNLVDDRPKQGPASKLLKRFMEVIDAKHNGRTEAG